VRNPVPPGGGSDPDPPRKIRQLAPRSVLTFNRAISADDYEAIAAQAPGVTRARAGYEFDFVQQRPVVKIWVGDDAGAVDAAKAALADTADPNRPASVELATAVRVALSVSLEQRPRFDRDSVIAAVRAALIDPDQGLLGLNVVQIGEAIYDSQIYAACLGVAGVQAVLSLSFTPLILSNLIGFIPRPLLDGAFFLRPLILRRPIRRPPANALGCQCDQRHDPGTNGYFVVADPDQNLQISIT
jgi:hypothetical protein